MPEQLHPCLIRVDGSESIGTGHIMRCLALANALVQIGHRVVFLNALCPYALKTWLQDEGHEVAAVPPEIEPGSDMDAGYTADFARQSGARHVVLDGYHFLSPVQKHLKESGLKILCIDDLAHCDYYFADLVLNQNPSADRTTYPNCDSRTDFLLGSDYILLRDDFLRYKKNNEPTPFAAQAKKILVTMGGSDIDNVTGTVVEALNQCPAELALDVTIAIGAGNQHSDWLQALAHKINESKGHTFRGHFNVKNMPELIGESDLVVSAGGTTVWEAAYLARPTAVIITADNQIPGMEHFAKEGAVELLGRQQQLKATHLTEALARLIKDQPRRKQLAERAATMVDGLGASRVVQRFMDKTI
jgi:UDP-2,4-diacetamido-2,4,6-trideoxy-beta-L-altropyranose hydrolase